ncbi:MAG: hypothetical protein HFJ41_00730 [Clostridia bacterium]|nr:hypothetical protein [Clostridia bacterium]
MLDIVCYILFFLFSIYVLIDSIVYSINEIKNEKNIFGGVCVIAFSVFCLVLGNIVVWRH